MANLEPEEIDERLSAVERDVKAKKFVEDTWHHFALAYFRGMTDQEAADALRDWCDRKGIEPILREGKTGVGGIVFKVIRLQLVPSP